VNIPIILRVDNIGELFIFENLMMFSWISDTMSCMISQEICTDIFLKIVNGLTHDKHSREFDGTKESLGIH